MSTAWLSFLEPHSEVPLAVFNYLKNKLPSPFLHKIYMDYGTGESDGNYVSTQSFANLIIADKGFSAPNFMSKVFEKDEHNEKAWSARLSIPFRFLLNDMNIQNSNFGQVLVYPNFKSQFVSQRNVTIWFPDDYSLDKKYDVLYMNDGQMLFDSAKTWNKQSWKADETALKLMKSGKPRYFIIVGIWNDSKTRHADYFPQKVYETLTESEQHFISEELNKLGRVEGNFHPISDNYLKFVVNEIKPFIDNHFSTEKRSEHTFMAGSSMGGLISLYAICEYPDIFGGVACLSTHWPGIFAVENNPIPNALYKYMKTNLPDPKNHKIYFDFGTATLDALYPPLQKNVDKIIKNHGFTSKNWVTKEFKDADHSEKSWSERLQIPFEFLLKK
jgi:predicted alpha/beta superfamily hydrolase